MAKSKITVHEIKTKDGSTLRVFYNEENDLLVVDKEKGKYGNEIVRRHLSDVEIPTMADFRKKKLKEMS